MVFPSGWSVQTGSQPVIVLYGLGLAIITLVGVIAPLLVGVTREDLVASEQRADQLESELAAVREERDHLQDELQRSRSDSESAQSEHEAELAALRTSQARFELYEDNAGEWRWRLRHRNGNVIADSGQGYSDRSNTRDGVEGVKRNAPNADVEESES